MIEVTLQEARERLPELIRLMAGGRQVIITDGGKRLAALATPPPMPQPPEEEAARQAGVRESIKAMVRLWVQEGRELPDDSPLLKLLEEA